MKYFQFDIIQITQSFKVNRILGKCFNEYTYNLHIPHLY